MGFWSNLLSPPESLSEHSTLAELIVSTQLQTLSFRQSQALSVAAVYRARQLNADIPASLPIKANGIIIPDTQERVAEIILSLQDHGDAYIAFSRDDWTILRNDQVRVTWDNNQRTRRYANTRGVEYRIRGVAQNLYVISINRGPQDLTGVGWLESDRIRGLIAEQKWSQEYFENNGAPTGLVEAPSKLTPDEAKALKQQWVDRSDGVRTPAVLSGGMTWRSTSFDANSSQWVEGHLVGIGDVAAMSGVDPTFLAYSPGGSSVTYSSRADFWRLYWAQTLHPTYVTRIEQALERVIGGTVQFDPEQLLVASLGERVRSAAELVRTGFDPEDSLDVVGLPPIPHTGFLPVTVQPQPEGTTI